MSEDWEKDVVADSEGTGEDRRLVLIDGEFEDGVIKSDTSVKLDKAQ